MGQSQLSGGWSYGCFLAFLSVERVDIIRTDLDRGQLALGHHHTRTTSASSIATCATFYSVPFFRDFPSLAPFLAEKNCRIAALQAGNHLS